ncbi:MAG: hypothetical protein ABI024_09390 [Vicinamibacterales bacterium]
MTELLARLGAAIGISLVLTLLLLVMYQDDGNAQMRNQRASVAITQASAVTASGTP